MDKVTILNNLNRIACRFEQMGDYETSSIITNVFIKISKSKLPKEMEGGHKSPPKGYPEKKKEYGDPANYKYPLDTERHVRAAWSYIHQERNRKQYSPAQFKAICERIKRAGKKFKIVFEDKD